MQTSYAQQKATGVHVGTVKGCSHRVTGRKAGGAAAQQDTITVDTAADDTTYALNIAFTNTETGEEFSEAISVDSGTGATKTSIRNQLITAINQNANLSQWVRAALKDSDEFYVTARIPGASFTLTESDGNLSTTTSTSASSGNPVDFGRLVVENASNTKECDHPRSGNATAAVYACDVDGQGTLETGDTIKVVLRMDLDGDGEKEKVAEVVALFDTNQDTTLDALVAVLNTALETYGTGTSILVAANDATATGLVFTSEIPGLDFDVEVYVFDASASETVPLTVTTTTANVALRPLGVSIHKHTEADANGDAYYRVTEMVNIHRGGDPILVELDASVTPSFGDPVWARMSASGTEELGAFRTSRDGADCIPLDADRWEWVGDAVVTDLSGKRGGYLRVNMA